MKHAADWAPSPQLTQTLDEMQQRLRADPTPAKNVIIADWHSWRVLRYYLEFDTRKAYVDLRASTTLVRGPLTGHAELAALVAATRDDAQARAGVTRIWLVVTKLDRFEALLSDPLVRELAVDTRRFATHDPAYHPILVELRVRGR